jgi:hypothetical protein
VAIAGKKSYINGISKYRKEERNCENRLWSVMSSGKVILGKVNEKKNRKKEELARIVHSCYVRLFGDLYF